jgi:hypothetical protein
MTTLTLLFGLCTVFIYQTLYIIRGDAEFFGPSLAVAGNPSPLPIQHVFPEGFPEQFAFGAAFLAPDFFYLLCHVWG